MNLRILITKANKEDALTITSVHREVVRSINAKYYDEKVITEWLEQISAQNVISQMETSKWLVAKIGEEVVAFAQYSLEEGELYQINVLPQHASKGIGQQLYRAVEKDFIKDGSKIIRLNSTINAKRFYAKMGFSRNANKQFILGSTTVDLVEMQKKLVIQSY